MTQERTIEIVRQWYTQGTDLYGLSLWDLIDYARDEARRQGLEDACKATCFWCDHDYPVEYRAGEWHHEAGVCQAPYIRDVMTDETYGRGVVPPADMDLESLAMAKLAELERKAQRGQEPRP